MRRGRNNQLLVRPILETIFEESPRSYELSHGLPGESTLESKNYSEHRIHQIGHNFFQRLYYNDMVKRARNDPTSSEKRDSLCRENFEENLEKYLADARSKKKKRLSPLDLILEESSHLRKYAQQRALIGSNVKRRMVKSFYKASGLPVKQLARQSALNAAHESLSKLASKRRRTPTKNRVGADGTVEDSRALPYPEDLPPEVIA